MSNHNKIRLVDKNNHSGKYKILFSTPQTKHTNIPKEFRGLQIYNNRSLAEEALRKRKRDFCSPSSRIRKTRENNR